MPTAWLKPASRLEAAGRIIEAGRRFCGELGNPAFLPRMQWVSALRRYLVGEWDDARADAEAGMAMLGEGGARQGAAYGHSLLALIGLYRGDFEEVEERLGAAEREVATAGPQYGVHWPVWIRGLLHEARGETDHALSCLVRLAGSQVHEQIKFAGERRMMLDSTGRSRITTVTSHFVALRSARKSPTTLMETEPSWDRQKAIPTSAW